MSLKRRYEREILRAQRPLVRRMQEHDSGAGVPMVLCVSAIGPSAGVQAPTAIELTDGWYRIHGSIDGPLRRAVSKGRVRVGQKIVISGAKVRVAAGTVAHGQLESDGEGRDALEALNRSQLVLSGNSTALAKWDTKLGRMNASPVFALTSFCNDGGLIALMDLIIEKLHPVGFVHSDKDIREAPWNDQEERLRQDTWNVGSGGRRV